MFKNDTGICEGMPYLYVRDNHEALVLLQTVCEKFGLFTERQVNRAIASRDIQVHVAHPTDEKFKHTVSGKSLDNFSIVSNDVTNTRAIFGPNRPGLRGKTVRAIIKAFSAYRMFKLLISRMSHMHLNIT